MAGLRALLLFACFLCLTGPSRVAASRLAGAERDAPVEGGSGCQQATNNEVAAAAGPQPTLHTLIATECSKYFTWQTIGLVYSIKRAGHPGPVTRLLSCTKEDWEALDVADRQLEDSLPVTTHWAPSYSVHPRTGDVYPGINKPVAVIDWLANTDVKEDYLLVIDADMVMRRPILPQELGAAPGTAVSGFFGYMIGVSNELALRHVPQVAPRNDTLAGPAGRRGDQVGGFTLMATDDMRRVAPLWLKLSEDVREDPLAWNLTGDQYALEGEKPWIAEMYGYSFGCAAAGVWHIATGRLMRYPGYAVDRESYNDPPSVLHYGILWNVSGTDYAFDKHWHYDFEALACPPWNMSADPRLTKRGLFAHPPRPSSFNTTGLELIRDLLAIEVLVTLNEAFCERHRRACPPSEELERECGQAEAIAQEMREAYARLPQQLPPEPEAAQSDVAPPDEREAVQSEAAPPDGDEGAHGRAADVEAAPGVAAAADAAVAKEEQRGEELAAAAARVAAAEQQGQAQAAEEQSSGRQEAAERNSGQQERAERNSGRRAAAAEVPAEPGPPSEADRPQAPSAQHTEL